MAYYGGWAPYVPVAERRRRAAREAKSLTGKGQKLRPICIPGRTIANSFWGKAWCQNLEKYADWANRMPRGRTYARNGSIVDLQISAGKITSLVYGSEMYRIQINIEKIKPNHWQAIRKDCATKVGSLIDLMRGKLPPAVLERLTSRKDGMFPSPSEISIRCSCPDGAVMCKHAAAALYGVGYLLDSEPELFFLMRGVSQTELVSDAMLTQKQSDAMGLDAQSTLDSDDLGALFGIDLSTAEGSTVKADSKSKQKAGARSPSKANPQASRFSVLQLQIRAAVKEATTKKEAATKKAAVKKAAVKKTATKEVATKKAVVKKKVAKKTDLKKTAVATLVNEKISIKKESVSKPKLKKAATAKKATTKKAATKKTAGQIVIQKKAASKQTATKKVALKKKKGK